jgi:hypothetical protein
MLDDKTFDQLSRYAMLLKDRHNESASALRAAIMKERNWDHVQWIYARDFWLLELRSRQADFYTAWLHKVKIGELDAREVPADPELGRLQRLVENEDGYPVAMSLAETALLLHAIRHPGIMRHVVERHLSELVHTLLRNEFEGSPEEEIYVENSIIGLVAALRPMLLTTVNAFFAMSDSERAQLRVIRDDLQRDITEAMLADPDSEIHHYPPLTEFDHASAAFHESIRLMDIGKRKRLAVEFITKPDAMIRNVQAAAALREVLGA